MWWIGCIIFIAVVWGAANILASGMRSSADESTNKAGKGLGFIIMFAFPLWLAGCTGWQSVHTVPAGNVGVVYQFGGITGQTGEGLVLTAPWQDLKRASVQTQRKRWEKMTAFSSETQDIYLAVSLNYSISPDAVQQLYRTVGESWFDTLVPQRVENFLKEATVTFETTDVAPNREAIRKVVREKLTAELKPFSITVSDFLIENIDFDKPFKDSIDRKQIATQDALAEKEKVAAEKNKADQKVETAKGEAQSIVERALGQAKANRELSASIDDRLIAYQTVQKWDGELSQVVGGGTPLIDLRAAQSTPAAAR